MLLTQTAEYALRAMACLCNEDGAPQRSKEISEKAGIPQHYVSKVMRRLVVAELVVSRRGHGGGFVLAKAPGEITFLDILNAADLFLHKERCAFGLGDCDLHNPCPLHPAWSQLKEQVFRWARTNTLEGVHSEGWTPSALKPPKLD